MEMPAQCHRCGKRVVRRAIGAWRIVEGGRRSSSYLASSTLASAILELRQCHTQKYWRMMSPGSVRETIGSCRRKGRRREETVASGAVAGSQAFQRRCETARMRLACVDSTLIKLLMTSRHSRLRNDLDGDANELVLTVI